MASKKNSIHKINNFPVWSGLVYTKGFVNYVSIDRDKLDIEW